MADAPEFTGEMGELQKLRVTVVILISQENTNLLRCRQRVAGKEIEVMCAERDLAEGRDPEAAQKLLDALYQEDTALRQDLSLVEKEIDRLHDVMAEIDADIARLCQS
jgi:hypothetical protein